MCLIALAISALALLSDAQAIDRAEIADLFAAAEIKRNSCEYREAATLFAETASLIPDNSADDGLLLAKSMALSSAARASLQPGLFEQAELYASRAKELLANSAALRERLDILSEFELIEADIALELGQFDRAEKIILRWAPQSNADWASLNSDSIFTLDVRLNIIRGNYLDAVQAARSRIAFLTQREAKQANLTLARLDLVDALIWAGELNEAERLLSNLRTYETSSDSSLKTRAIFMDSRLQFERSNLDLSLKSLQRINPEIDSLDECRIGLTFTVIHQLGIVHLMLRQPREAVVAFETELALLEAYGRTRTPRYLEAQVGLAQTKSILDQHASALELFNQSIEQSTEIFGESGVRTYQIMMESALAHARAGRGNLAMHQARQAVASVRSGSDARTIDEGYALAALGFAQRATRDLEAAEQSFRQAQAVFMAVRGQYSFDLWPSLIAIAEIRLEQEEWADALESLQYALEIQIQNKTLSGIGAGYTHSLMAKTYLGMKQETEALAQAEVALDVLSERLANVYRDADTWSFDEQEQAKNIVDIHDQVFWATNKKSRSVRESDLERVLRSHQLRRASRTGMNVSSAREMLNLPEASRDLLEQKRRLSRVLEIERQKYALQMGAGQTISNHNREFETLASTLASLATINEKIFEAGINTAIPSANFMTLDDVYRSMQFTENGLLLAFSVGRQGTTVLAFGQGRAAAYKIDVSETSLREGIERLNEVGDYGRWGASVWEPDFPVQTARQLYDTLLSPILAEFPDTERIHIISDGPLDDLSFAILRMPEPLSDHLGWLGANLPIDYLPALQVLKERDGESRATKPFFGAAVSDFSLLGAQQALSNLPNTASETDDLAELLSGTVWNDSVEKTKADLLNEPLDDYRLLSFATHALNARNASTTSEPGLVLWINPTTNLSEVLSVSEIEMMKLDAELVLLSACQSAAPDLISRGELFSGLARGFLVSGARSVLVARTDVDDYASRLFAPEFIKQYQITGDQSAALMLALRFMIESDYSHPGYWSAYSLVSRDI